MPVAERPGQVPVVDGTRRECTGLIAALEKELRSVPAGAPIRAIVGDVPTRIDVHAWAERKGHAIESEVREAGRFHLTIVKGGAADGPRDPTTR